MNLLFEEIKKITRRKQFWVIIIIIYGSVFADFFLTCNHFYGKPLSLIPSAYHCFISRNYCYNAPRLIFDSFLFPLVASMIASDSYYEEKIVVINNFIFTRVSKIKYIKYKALSIAIVVFIVVFTAILLSIILALSAFPIQGHYTNMVPFKIIMEPDKTKVFSYLRAYYPYLNVIAFACVLGAFGVSSSILSFSMSFLRKVNRYFIILSSMLFYIIYTLIMYLVGSIPLLSERVSQIIFTEILYVNPYGSIWMIVFFLFIEIAISIVLIRKGINLSHED